MKCQSPQELDSDRNIYGEIYKEISNANSIDDLISAIWTAQTIIQVAVSTAEKMGIDINDNENLDHFISLTCDCDEAIGELEAIKEED